MINEILLYGVDIIFSFILFFALLVGMIFFHELGHILMSYSYTKNKEVRLSYYPFKRKIGMEDNKYSTLARNQKINVILTGIISGAYYLFIMIYLTPSLLFDIAFLAFYLLGIKKDVKEVWSLWRGTI